jgi:hypothetical protein
MVTNKPHRKRQRTPEDHGRENRRQARCLNTLDKSIFQLYQHTLFSLELVLEKVKIFRSVARVAFAWMHELGLVHWDHETFALGSWD